MAYSSTACRTLTSLLTCTRILLSSSSASSFSHCRYSIPLLNDPARCAESLPCPRTIPIRPKSSWSGQSSLDDLLKWSKWLWEDKETDILESCANKISWPRGVSPEVLRPPPGVPPEKWMKLLWEKVEQMKRPYEGFDYEHWLVVMELPTDQEPSFHEMLETSVKTLASVVESEEEAAKKIYSVSTTGYTGFRCLISEELSNKIEDLPGVLSVIPDPDPDPELPTADNPCWYYYP